MKIQKIDNGAGSNRQQLAQFLIDNRRIRFFYWLDEEIWICAEPFFVPLRYKKASKSLKPIALETKGV
jgi:hypothetical protein